MRAELRELWKFRELLYSMVERELRIRYKNSFLGFFWSLINPLITVLVITLVFKNVMNNETQNLGAYILAAYLPFMFFQLCLMDSAQTIISALPIIRKIYFPREILPLATVISNFIHLLLALAVFFLYLMGVYLFSVFTHAPGETPIWPFQWTTLFVPFLLLINLALVTGLSLIISALNTFYEDVKYIVSVLLYLLFFICPVMYFTEQVYYKAGSPRNPRIWYDLYMLNPIGSLCNAYRKVLLAPQPVEVGGKELDSLPLDWVNVGITAVISFAILLLGYRMFNRMKWRFVERP
jgi:lipopolysaccharide transport system permease protein